MATIRADSWKNFVMIINCTILIENFRGNRGII